MTVTEISKREKGEAGRKKKGGGYKSKMRAWEQKKIITGVFHFLKTLFFSLFISVIMMLINTLLIPVNV